MAEMKIYPLNLAEPTDKLKELIAEHPDYPKVAEYNPYWKDVICLWVGN
jgi:hypothetical protein